MARKPIEDRILRGDCRKLLALESAKSVDLIVTSPPYGDNRKSTYRGVPIDAYVEWFLPISEQLHRVLRDRGSFVLNIKERVVSGERSTHVIELILALRRQGWLWTEEYIWHKRNSYPGKWPNRFRDAWERCLHFTKQRDFEMYQDAVRVPIGDWAAQRLSRLSEKDLTRDPSRVGSPFAKRVANWVGKEFVYPDNVIHIATESQNRSHSAAFPIGLPEYFIKLFTRTGGVVLDPFLGSGTTAMAAVQLGRHYVGMELDAQYCRVARQAIASTARSGSDLRLEQRAEEIAPRPKRRLEDGLERKPGSRRRVSDEDHLRLHSHSR